MKNNWKSQNKTRELIGCCGPEATPIDLIVPIPELLIGPCVWGGGVSFISESIRADKEEKFELLKEEIHQSGVLPSARDATSPPNLSGSSSEGEYST